MASLNKFRSKNLINRSHDKLHGLTMCAIMVFNMFVECYGVITTKIQAFFLSRLLERKETTQAFHHEVNGGFKTVTELNGCDRRKLRIDQHCSYSTILT